MDSDITYEKRFRLSIIVSYAHAEPLRAVDERTARQHAQEMLNYARDKYSEMPGDDPVPVRFDVEDPPLNVSLRDRVEAIIRALERKGFDVT